MPRALLFSSALALFFYSLDPLFGEVPPLGRGIVTSPRTRGLSFASLLHQPLPVSPLDPYLRREILTNIPSGLASINGCFLINLDCRRGRRQRCEAALNAQGVQFSRVSAVVGAHLPMDALRDLGLHWQPWMQFKPVLSLDNGERRLVAVPQPQDSCTYFLNSSNMGRGALGCLLSHISIWQAAWDAGLERIWILEDDFEFVRPVQDLENRVAELDHLVGPEGWDLLYTDPDQRASVRPNRPWPCLSRPIRPDFQLTRSISRQSISNHLETLALRWGTCSMVINRSGLKKLLTFFRHFGCFGPLDWDLHLVPGLREYACKDYHVTNLVSGSSDIQQESKRRGPTVETGDDPEEVYATLGAQ